MVGSIHDLQAAATYMGGSRIRAQSQRTHSNHRSSRAVPSRSNGHQVGNWVMDLLSIDESDAIYHSFRSTMTIGLEIGSLIAGGCV